MINRIGRQTVGRDSACYGVLTCLARALTLRLIGRQSAQSPRAHFAKAIRCSNFAQPTINLPRSTKPCGKPGLGGRAETVVHHILST